MRECPFCGCRKTSVKPLGKYRFYVRCDTEGCGARGPVSSTKAQAEDDWSGRHRVAHPPM